MDWLTIEQMLDRHGWPTALVVLGIIAARRICRFLSPHVVNFFSLHTSFVTCMMESQKRSDLRDERLEIVLKDIKDDTAATRNDVVDLRSRCMYGAQFHTQTAGGKT
mgnify:FL=1